MNIGHCVLQESQISMSDKDIQVLADALINRLVTEREKKGFNIPDEEHYLQHQDLKAVITDFKDIRPILSEFKEFIEMWRDAKGIFRKFFMACMLLGAMVLFGLGIGHKIKDLF